MAAPFRPGARFSNVQRREPRLVPATRGGGEERGLRFVHRPPHDATSLGGVRHTILPGRLAFSAPCSGNLAFLSGTHGDPSTLSVNPRPRASSQAQEEALSPTLLELVRAA